MFKLLEKLSKVEDYTVRKWYGYITIVLAVMLLISIFMLNFWVTLALVFAVGYSLNYCLNEGMDITTYIMISVVTVVLMMVTLDSHKENPSKKTVIELLPVREATFSDDTKTVHFKVGATEEIRSVKLDELDYYKNKANFYKDFKDGQTEVKDGECYLVMYNNIKLVLDTKVLDKNVTLFECN